MPSDQSESKIERSEILIENPGHVTHIDNNSLVKDSKYKITRIVTTVEVTLQPGDTAFSRIDTVSTENVPGNEKDEAKMSNSTEEVDNIKSMLEVTNTHSVEEIVEKVVTLESVIDIIREAGLETSNLIFGNTRRSFENFLAQISIQGSTTRPAISIKVKIRSMENPCTPSRKT